MTARIYTGVEAMVLREAATPGPWFVDEWDETDDDGSQHGLMIVGSNRDRGRPVFFDEGGVDADDMALAAAAPDLAASVCYHAAETRREQGRVSGLMLLLDDEKTKRVAAEQECATLRARVAELESLAAGPRSLTIDAAACDALDAWMCRTARPEPVGRAPKTIDEMTHAEVRASWFDLHHRLNVVTMERDELARKLAELEAWVAMVSP